MKWFRSYLKDREQAVLCHNELSEKRHSDIGVPQGSVLGPLLFTAHVNYIIIANHGACNLYPAELDGKLT